MLLNYLKTAWRNLVRGKSFSVINISGLAIGIAGALMILLWLQNEVSYDKFHTNADRIYEVYGMTSMEGKLHAINATSQPLGPALQSQYPEVEAFARVQETDGLLLTAGEKRLSGIKGAIVDPAFLKIFSFPFAKGRQQASDVSSIIITEKLAVSFFGNSDPLNKMIRIDSTDNFVVAGVLHDLPINTRFEFRYLLPWDYLKKKGWNNDSWESNNISTFLQLKPQTDIAAFNRKIENATRHATGKKDIWTHFLFPLSKWHLYANFENGKPVSGRITTVRLFAVIALFILLIACINFMNLSTARSESRAKEVGIRKVSGAGKGLLIGQFIAEAFLHVLIATIIGIVFLQISLPVFNSIIGSDLQLPWTNIYAWLFVGGFILFTGLLAGSYPAFYLSSFSPVGIFRKQFKKPASAISPRKILVVLQFTFAVILIISTIVVRNQVIHAQERDRGYAGSGLIDINLNGDIEKNYSLIKDELLKAGIATSVTKTMASITHIGTNSWGLRWKGRDDSFDAPIALFSADADLVKTTGLQLLEGRDIDIQKYPTDSFAVLLNQTAVKTMQFTDPVGQVITQPSKNLSWHVVGVLKDHLAGSPYQAVQPMVIMGPGSWFNLMEIKLSDANSPSGNLKHAEKIFARYNPAYPFDYRFADDEYAKAFEDEIKSKKLAGLFATLAIFISCLGLFGLSAFVAESRVKEIGVRKVLGASSYSITRLLSLDFLKLVLISNFIAIPVAWYAMRQWLNNFEYRIDLTWSIFLIAAIFALGIALITVSFQSIKAAAANPVKNLRAE